MAEKENVNIFDFYTKIYRSWADSISSYTRLGAGLPGAFKAPNSENWFKPFWGNMGDWGNLNASFVEMTKGLPLPFESVKAMNEGVSRGINMYVNTYDVWLRSMEKVAREGFEVGRKLGAGEKVDTASFLESVRAASDDVNSTLVESLKETPFAGVKEIDEAVRRALAALPEEQKVARAFLEELFSFSSKASSLSTSAMAEAVKNFTDMLNKGTITADTYRNLVDSYGAMLKNSMEILRPSAKLFPGYGEVVDAAVDWAQKNLEVYSTWLEISLKLQKGTRESFEDIYKSAEGILGAGRAVTADEFLRKWSEAYQKAATAMVERSQMFASIPAFLDKYTEYVKATSKLYRSVMTPPLVPAKDVEDVSERIEKVKTAAEKRASKAGRAAG